MSAAARVTDLRKAYGSRVVLDGINLEIERGEFVALLGASGTGKTTLLRILAGLEESDGGEALVPDARTVVFQEPRLIPSQRVLGNVTVGLPRSSRIRAAAHDALREVGLAGRGKSWPGTLSGGEAQRVALARALVREPDLLLLDEPFAALDALTRLRMHALIERLVARHRPGVLLVTHDVDEALRLADRVIVLQDGHFVRDDVVAIPKPRRLDDPALAPLRQSILESLGVDGDSRWEEAS